ncbi:hypothetical protein CY34DRAFT_814305, partial [Suillus luteus UH-Slu-Lm8-n1]
MRRLYSRDSYFPFDLAIGRPFSLLTDHDFVYTFLSTDSSAYPSRDDLHSQRLSHRTAI